MADVDPNTVFNHRREASRFFLAMVAVCVFGGFYFLTQNRDTTGFGLIFGGSSMFLVAGGYVRKDELPEIPKFLSQQLGGAG